MDHLQHPEFGHLTWDSLLNCWLGGMDLRPDFHVEVTISGTPEDQQLGIPAALNSLLWLRNEEGHARHQVAVEMSDLYNDCWTDEEEPVTPAEFAERIELIRASFGEDGSVLLSYSDGPTHMFGGHLLDAQFDPDKKYIETILIG